MRMFIVGLLCALSYAQTETAVGKNDGWYVHCTGAMLEIAESKKFLGSNQALSSKMFTREKLAELKIKDPEEAAKFPLLTFFIKLDAPAQKGRLGDAYAKIPLTRRLTKQQISGCIVLTDPSNLVDDALEEDGAGKLLHPSAYPKVQADEILLTADGDMVGGVPSMKVEGYFADFTRCDKKNAPDSEECKTETKMMAAFSNAFTGEGGNGLKYDFTIFGQGNANSPEFAAACTKYITETFKGDVRGETSVAEDNFNTVLQNKNFHYFVVPATLILFFAIIWGVQNSKRSNSDYSQLLEQDEV